MQVIGKLCVCGIIMQLHFKEFLGTWLLSIVFQTDAATTASNAL